jgi:uncharacterized membrane-anchored protein
MAIMTQTLAQPRPVARQMLNKVPEVTVYFWIIKILATTVGESAADYINETLGFGLVKTSLLATALLIAVLVWQFRLKRYVPGVYWLAVVLISVVGTLLTDNLHDGLHVGLLRSSTAFAVLLAITFALWYRSEGTLSIHSIVSARREAFYWTAVLFTFALGTAAGDLVAEKLNIGYFNSVILFFALIGLVFVAYRYLNLNAILGFWTAYVLTRPLGASMGDLLSQPRADGGLGLGTTVTSIVFLAAIVVVVSYMTAIQKKQALAAIA